MAIPSFDVQDCDLVAFQNLINQTLKVDELAFASRVEKYIPIYDRATYGPALADDAVRQALLKEWGDVLSTRSGVVVLKGAYEDTTILDEATKVYLALIAREKAAGTAQADHFATAGANDRLWNALQKLSAEDPGLFARYFGNEAIAGVCEAWLGPYYQMTAQVNVVHPGGQAQSAHRDYHLGFQSEETAGQFPSHVHILSSVLTLQGGIAHCDMPIESGPTKLLPFSQLYPQGYMAYRREEFSEAFEASFVQLPLEKGDAFFFNPALFHAAGENRTNDIERFANLLQISSAFGRAMETVDRTALCKQLYPALQALLSAQRLSPLQADAAISATAEGYAFPTNLDTDPPVGGLAPETQADLFRRALKEGLSASAFEHALSEHAARRAP